MNQDKVLIKEQANVPVHLRGKLGTIKVAGPNSSWFAVVPDGETRGFLLKPSEIEWLDTAVVN